MIEFLFTCPYCWENQIKLVDSSIDNQSFIEDCEICCNPIQISVVTEAQQIVNFQAENIEQ